jgi:ribose-phosphate pyrophosphokinase
MDVHNPAAFQNAFRCRAENLEANGLFVAHFAPLLAAGDEVAVVSPDAGGIKRAEAFRQRLAGTLGRPVNLAFAEKHRAAGVVSGEAFVGDVAGKVAIIIDDLVSAGHTIDRAARACVAHGAKGVHAAATHGVFAAEADAVLAVCPLESLVVTDTIAAGRLRNPRLVTLRTAGLFAEAIARLHTGGSITELLER